jgi:hypothetical protein
MKYAWMVVGGAALALLAVVVPVTSQAQSKKKWTPSRTADGQPDMQGVWANNLATPLQRPPQWAGKPSLTDAELDDLKRAAAEVVEGDGDAQFGDGLVLAALDNVKNAVSSDPTGNYNQFWVTEREFENRTSLITDPPDGHLPPLTPEAAARRTEAAERARLHGFDSWANRSLSERCLSWGVPRIQAAYNSHFQILQTRSHFVFYGEMAHDARIIPIDGRPHLPPGVRSWLGDSRGHWEGDTMVVETTNFSPKSNFQGAHEHLHLVEKFTRVSPDLLNYEATMADPTTWTRPWTLMIPLRHTNELIYEYACHEGNYALANILAGARAQERAESRAPRAASR